MGSNLRGAGVHPHAGLIRAAGHERRAPGLERADREDTLAKHNQSESTSGVFKYMGASVQPSLFRNGKVLTRRDQDGSDASWQGASFVDLRVPLRNACLLKTENRRTVVANGFELLDRSVSTASIDFLDHCDVVRNYYPQCVEIVREAPGPQAFAFDHNVRSASGKKNQQRIAGGQQVQGPAQVIQRDYTLTIAPQRLRDLTRPPGANDTVPTLAEPSARSGRLPDTCVAETGRCPSGYGTSVKSWLRLALAMSLATGGLVA